MGDIPDRSSQITEKVAIMMNNLKGVQYTNQIKSEPLTEGDVYNQINKKSKQKSTYIMPFAKMHVLIKCITNEANKQTCGRKLGRLSAMQKKKL